MGVRYLPLTYLHTLLMLDTSPHVMSHESTCFAVVAALLPSYDTA